MRKFLASMAIALVSLFAFSQNVDAQSYLLNENFNNITSGIPSGWDRSEGTTTSDAYKWTSHSAGYTGSCMRFDSYYNDNGNTSVLKTPMLDLSSGEWLLKFKYKNPSGGDFSVFISSDGGATYTTSLRSALSNQSDWTDVEISLSSFTSSTTKIVFVGTSNYGSGDAYIYLDDVSVESVTACMTPKALTAQNITSSSASLSWALSSGHFAPGSYIYTLTDAAGNIIEQNNALSAPSLQYTIAATLSPNTTYTATLQGDCQADGFSNTASVTFTTLCGAIDYLPYTMGFEDNETFCVYGNYRRPSCWTVYNSLGAPEDGYSSYPYATAAARHNGSMSLNYAGSSSYSSYADTITMASPQLNTTLYPLNTLSVKFWTAMGVAANSMDLYVGVMTDPDDATTFVPVDTVSVTGSSFVRHSVDFSGYTGSGEYIAFFWHKQAIPSGAVVLMYLDDVTIEPTPACSDFEAAVSVSDITDSSVSLSFNDTTVTAWQYAVGTHGTHVALMTPVSASGNSCTVTGLSALTTYDLYLRTDCGNNQFGAWSAATTFTTTDVPAQMPYVCGFEDAQENAHWQFVDGAGSNLFAVGSDANAVYEGNNALYVTDNRLDADYTYDNNSASLSFAYRTLHFDSKVYKLEMRFKSTGGEGYWDFGRAFLTNVAESLPAGQQGDAYYNLTFPAMVAELDEDFVYDGYYKVLNCSTYVHANPDADGWVQISYFLDMINAPGNYNLVFMWNNDNRDGNTSYPLSVDDINISEVSCFPPAELQTLNLKANSVDLDFAQADASEWLVVVSNQPVSKEFIPDSCIFNSTVTSSTLSLSGLEATTDYFYMVRTLCDEDEISYSALTGSFRTPRVVFESDTIYATVCYEEDYVDNGFNIPADELAVGENVVTRLISDTVASDVDTLVIVNIYKRAFVWGNDTVNIFPGESYEWHGVTYTEEGIYVDTLQSAEGCDSITTLYLYVATDEAVENVMTVRIDVVPNPVQPGMTAYLYGEYGDVDYVEILNNMGQIVDRFSPASYPVEVKGIESAGLYYVRLVTKTGNVYTEKLIVK